MEIDKDQLSGFKTEIENLHGLLSDIANEGCNRHIITISNLLDNEQIDWDEIKCLFKEDSKNFEGILFKLHLKRNVKISLLRRDRIIIFLSIGYLYSKDIRYFNEFLYFYRETDNNKEYWFLMLKLFFDNLTEDNHHQHSFCNDMDRFMKETNINLELARKKKVDTSLRVGLLGSPTFFRKIRANLVSKGFNVRCYFIPFHPNKKINFVLKSRILFWLLCLAYGINFKFIRLNFNHKVPRIGELLEADELDIGFHKLGFIIKNNIIDPFKIGIINDHWAILPYIRGRSTIEYSLLFGIPVIATTHIVQKGVDSGDIINLYRYDKLKNTYSKICQIRNHIRRERDLRAIDSIEMLSRTKGAIAYNNPEKGLMFYSMHPCLMEFIENNILKQKAI